ncbi:putative F-box/FBD/LRR-repeat protein [Cardamine amara subsp. amara]|uniref:F-box/FBD/LRR-repeat protein n=1 Tax=Cardamine amara subsp. amara TaxID=228776 RepID=A0ABD1BK15_CARAN
MLRFLRRHPNYDIEDQPCLVSETSSVPKCLSFHLETLQWIGYAGRHEEIEAAVYILKNAHCLKNATENDLMMIKELLSSKASPLCLLLIVL